MILRRYYDEWLAYKATLKSTQPWKYWLFDLLETIAVAFAAALLIRAFVLQVSVVPTGSMIPTMKINDRLLVNKFIYRFVEPQVGDIVVFESPHGDGNDFVKRCVAVAGETVELRQGILLVDGRERYFPGVVLRRDYSEFGPIMVGEAQYFMMGDNRGNSMDSRIWGTVSSEMIKGKAWFTFWPFSRIQVLY